MLRPELLRLLVCPENQAPLEFADRELLARINNAIAAGRLRRPASVLYQRFSDRLAGEHAGDDAADTGNAHPS